MPSLGEEVGRYAERDDGDELVGAGRSIRLESRGEVVSRLPWLPLPDCVIQFLLDDAIVPDSSVKCLIVCTNF